MRDTPWHTRARAPEPASATIPAPQQTTFRRLVIVNQELAQHNAKVRLVSFPPEARGRAPRATQRRPDRRPSSRVSLEGTLLSPVPDAGELAEC